MLISNAFVQVFHLYIVLGLQNLLCLWFYAFGISHSFGGDSVCNHCVHIFSFKR